MKPTGSLDLAMSLLNKVSRASVQKPMRREFRKPVEKYVARPTRNGFKLEEGLDETSLKNLQALMKTRSSTENTQ
jgi:hypothetical protein